jgi:hypothetical protein
MHHEITQLIVQAMRISLQVPVIHDSEGAQIGRQKIDERYCECVRALASSMRCKQCLASTTGSGRYLMAAHWFGYQHIDWKRKRLEAA